MERVHTLGKYEIRGELGRGAMGVVYQGYDPDIDRLVAIKTLKKDTLDISERPAVLERFKREAQAGGRLVHPNIAAIYDYGEDENTAFITMETIQGRGLKELFDQNQRFHGGEIVRLMTQLLETLDYAHSRGVVHRDIKPSNLILMGDGTLKITDFGIARVESSTLTQAGTVLGTPSYMSPEQYMGQIVDGRSDLFAAGVILYQFLTGEKPFVGASITTIMHKVLKEMPANPSDLNVQVPPAFDWVVHKALAKRPAERYQTAREFLDDLKAADEGRLTQAHSLPEDDATISHIFATEEVKPQARRKPWAWIGVGLAASAMGLAAIAPVFKPTPPVSAPIALVSPPPQTAAAPGKDTLGGKPGKAKKTKPPSEEKHLGRRGEENKPAAAKRGFFGEELRPSQWKRGDGPTAP
ncbi:MAG: serine/threonine-protein kinase [Burkholderiales bacterium]